jgi:hypothetical protein
MNDDGRRRGLRGTRDSGAPAQAGSVPRPNVLSDASPPNRLSTETAPNAGGLGGTQASVTPASGPQVNSRGSVVPSDVGTGQARLRLPGLSTLIFVGFVALTAFRIVGEFIEQNAVPPPATTSPAETTSPVAPGPVTFGTRATEECEVIGAGVEFDDGADVWWSATMSTTQPTDAAVVVIILRNGVQLTREDVPADESAGDWDLLCSSGPIEQDIVGRYRVEVWNADRSVILAAGEYVIS